MCDLINLVHIQVPECHQIHQSISKWFWTNTLSGPKYPRVTHTTGISTQFMALQNFCKSEYKSWETKTKPRSLPDASQCSAVFDFLHLSGSNWLLRQLPCSLHISFHASLNIALTNYKNIINISTLNLQPLDVDDVGLYHPDNQAVQNIWGECSHLSFLYAQKASFILAVPASSYRETEVRRSKLLQEVETPEKRQTLHLHRLVYHCL